MTTRSWWQRLRELFGATPYPQVYRDTRAKDDIKDAITESEAVEVKEPLIPSLTPPPSPSIEPPRPPVVKEPSSPPVVKEPSKKDKK